MDSKSARYGAYLILIAAIQFIVLMTIAQARFPCTASCYSILTNPISDLGNTLISPLWPLFNYSLVIFGILVVSGIFLLKDSFGKSKLAKIGLALIALAGFGGAGVGTVPENTILLFHSLFALIAFGAGGLGVLLIGISVAERKKNRSFSIYSILTGILVIGALVFAELLPVITSMHWAMSGSGFGFGGIERVVALPTILWLIVAGILLVRKQNLFSK